MTPSSRAVAPAGSGNRPIAAVNNETSDVIGISKRVISATENSAALSRLGLITFSKNFAAAWRSKSRAINTLENVIRSLLDNNCQVYVVKTKDFENFKRTGVRAGNANIRTLDAERRMIEIAQQTGGAVYSPIDEREMNRAFDRISAELSQQYVLSYYPEDDAGRQGEFRNITLTVKDRPNLNLRTRKGYYVRK